MMPTITMPYFNLKHRVERKQEYIKINKNLKYLSQNSSGRLTGMTYDPVILVK